MIRRVGLNLLAAAMVLTATAGFALAIDEEIRKKLEKEGAAFETVAALEKMHQDEKRTRPPVIGPPEMLDMLNRGWDDETIRLFIGLDWITSSEAMPITPDQAHDLIESGLAPQSLRVMLASEIALRTEKKDDGRAAGGPENTKPVPVREGESAVVYRTPFDRESTGLKLEVEKRADGKEAIVYYSYHPEGEAERAAEQAEQHRRDMEILQWLGLRVITEY
jgi:hypothetical protein